MIYPVILCGGSGTRLWPLSRRDYPKQFATIFGGESLFQAALRRFPSPEFAPPLLVSHADFRFLVGEQLAALDMAAADILLEPEARNTGPAILSAALHLRNRGAADAVMAVAPSDHVVHDPDAFRTALNAGRTAAEEGRLVTFGVRPDRPETGYGYLELAAATRQDPGRPAPVVRFVEKPDAARAASMLASDRFLWNAGIFMFRVRDVIAAFEALAPDMVAPCGAALAGARPDLDFIRLDPAAYAEAPETSIDYAVMEKAEAVSVVPLDCGWSDLGTWESIWREMGPDARGVAVDGKVTELGCSNALLRSEAGGPRLVGVNLDGVAVVAMNDAVLVADKRDMQAVKAAVAQMRAEGVPEADARPRTYRPWGWYEAIARGPRFQVKQIVVPPGRQLSLQSHVHRSEHWVVVAGTARVTIASEVQLVTENQSVYIPIGAVHRLENPGKVDLHLIEVQTGSYLGEDDITRYEDVYNRG